MDQLTQTQLIEKATTLVQALPYMQHLSGKTVVIKYGGNAMLNDDLTETILQDIALIKCVGVNPIVVHGGGPEINNLLSKLNISSSFHNGLRITDKDTMEVVQMVLTGKINKDITSKLNALGAKAIGLCGKDANLIEAVKIAPQDGIDMGYVGEITSINTKILGLLSKDEYIPVIAPVGVGPEGESYNINADTVAGEIAATLKAEKLIYLTDVDGVRANAADPSTLISHIDAAEIAQMVESGAIDGGMIPKVSGCLKAVKSGVNRTHILDGTIPHPILLEIFTIKGIGTMVVDDKSKYQEELCKI